MNVRRGRSAFLILALVLVCGLTWGMVAAMAADESASPTAAASPGGELLLKIGWMNDVDNLNPYIGYETSTYEVLTLNYSTLMGYGLNTEPVPDLATEVPTKENGGISEDGLTWTFHLKPGLKWSDGQPLTAEDVEFTYNFAIDNEMASYATVLTGVKAARMVDPQTVEILFSKPKADFYRIWIPILPKHIWSKVSAKEAANSYENKPPVVGSGPFVITDRKVGKDITLERNPYWYGKKPAVSKIIFVTYQQADTMYQELKAGNIDAAQGIPQAVFPTLQKDDTFEAIAYNFFNWDYVCMNSCTGPSKGNPALKDPKFRAALNWAIDRQKCAEIGYAGYAEPGTTLINPDSFFDPDYHWEPPAGVKYEYDPEKAKSLLDEAGYTDTDGDGTRDYQGEPIELRLYSRSESAEESREAKLIVDWFRQVGIKVKLEALDDGELSNRIWAWDNAANDYVPDFDMYIWDWDAYYDPGDTLGCFVTSQIGMWNEPYWSNKEYDALNDQQFVELDANKRAEIIKQMQEIMYTEAPFNILTYPQYMQAYNVKKWTGWTRLMDGKGPAIYTASNRDTYLNLTLNTGEGASAESSSTTGLYVGIAVAVVVVAVIVIVVVSRRGKRQVEES
jgi:peptide/nickel transport system substrate-binding protein